MPDGLSTLHKMGSVLVPDGLKYFWVESLYKIYSLLSRWVETLVADSLSPYTRWVESFVLDGLSPYTR